MLKIGRRGECGHERHASSGCQRLPHINSGLWHVVCSLFSQFIAATSRRMNTGCWLLNSLVVMSPISVSRFCLPYSESRPHSKSKLQPTGVICTSHKNDLYTGEAFRSQQSDIQFENAAHLRSGTGKYLDSSSLCHKC